MKRKTHIITLLLFVFAIALMIQSCKDKEEDNNSDNDDLYMVTTYNIFHHYYKPKKANLFPWIENVIVGDWYSNENARYSSEYRDVYGGNMVASDTDDYEQKYAEHYFFLDDKGFKKYCEASDNSDKRIIIDEKDIISPFKEYASYYGDTTHLTNHDGIKTNSQCGADNACVLPLLAIDVVTNKDFDEGHLAGSKLNDILFYDQSLDRYSYLQDKEYQEEKLYSGIGSCKEFEPRRLSQIPENPVYLMESHFVIRFDHAPTTPGTYEFTIKFTFGPDPLSGETVDIEPVTVSMEF
ncbi:MAG: hypothetical protein J6U21_11900 [Bacteroidales bacterium]|nr:hypothetical protein [Bacteroidales bacterium]